MTFISMCLLYKMKRSNPNCSLVTRTKKPRKVISSEKYDEYSDEDLWTFFKKTEGISFETFKKNLPDLRNYFKQVRVSEGFDVDVVPKVCIHGGYVIPDDCCPEKWTERYEALMNLARLSIKDNRKLFQRFEVEKVLKANIRMSDLYVQHFLTFTAVNIGKRGHRGDPVTFQNLVFVRGLLIFNIDGEKIIEFCRLKPEEASVEETVPDKVPLPICV